MVGRSQGEMDNHRPVIARWRVGAYASGNFGKNLLWGSAEVTLLFMLTDMLGLSSGVAGAILLGAVLVEAALTPAIGLVTDRRPTRLGRYGLPILVGAPVCAVLFVALYALPVAGTANVALVALLVVGFRLTYAVFDIPHNALLARVGADSPARARISLYRFFFSSLAALTLSLALAPLVRGGEGPPLSPGGLLIYAALVAVVASLAVIGAWSAVRHVAPGTAAPAASTPPGRRTWEAVWRTPSLLAILAAGTVASLCLPLFNKSVLYLANTVLARPEMASPILTAMVVGQFLGLGLWLRLADHPDKARTLQWAHAAASAGGLLFLLFGRGHPTGLMLASGLLGVGAAGVYGGVWGMIADCARRAGDRHGVHIDGQVFALAILLQKVAIGLGVALFGWGLDLAGYQPGAQAGEQVRSVILLFGLGVPVLGGLACILILTAYRPADDPG